MIKSKSNKRAKEIPLNLNYFSFYFTKMVEEAAMETNSKKSTCFLEK